jgi:hypothetical protein
MKPIDFHASVGYIDSETKVWIGNQDDPAPVVISARECFFIALKSD